MKLISMTDFVLEQQKEIAKWGLGEEPRLYRRITNYANFLKQPLTLGMFVPVDEEGNVLEEPKPNDLNDSFFKMQIGFHEEKKYIESKEKVLFEGWKLIDPNKNLGFKIVRSEDFEINLDTLSSGQFVEGGYLDFIINGNSIGAIANVFIGVTLTETAIKMIYGD